MSTIQQYAILLVALAAVIAGLLLALHATLESLSGRRDHIDVPGYSGPDRRNPFAGDLPAKGYDGVDRRKQQPAKTRLIETAVSRFWGALS